MRVLVVDDDPFFSTLFSRFFTSRGWAADAGDSVFAVLGLFLKGRYNLVLCDIELPDGDGVALAQALMDAQPSLRVIMTSGNPENLARARQAGFALCLPKPFAFAELSALLDWRDIPHIRYAPDVAKILIVDDDPVIVELLTAKFQAGGHQVFSATDAYGATPAAVNFKPDLITLDFDLPAGNGFTTLARLRGNTATANTPVIFISGKAAADLQASAPRDLKVRFLTKPVSMAKLDACVAELLKTASSGDILDLDA